MIGAQIGGEAKLLDFGMLSIDGVVKAAALYNSADSTFDVTNFQTNFSAFTTVASKSRWAFLGEAELASTLQLTDWLAVSGGFQAMWLEGVALAPTPRAQGNPYDLNMDGSLFYHGGFLRLVGTY